MPNFSLNFDFFDQVCPKREFPVENRKVALVQALMVVTYHIQLFCTGTGRRNSILISLLLQVTETTTVKLVVNLVGFYGGTSKRMRIVNVLADFTPLFTTFIWLYLSTFLSKG